MRRVLTTLLAACALVALVPGSASAAGGYNDFHCKTTKKRPLPVVLVHGTFADAALNWSYVAPRLARAGYCVFALDYGVVKGVGATGDIPKSAAELRAYVNRVRRATGAKRVQIVGHSQGGMMPRYYLRFLGGARYVEELVALSPSNHGTKVAEGIDTPDCPACEQQATNSPLLRKLNRGHEVEKGVDYTVVQTKLDQTVVPYTSAFLEGPRAQVTNVLVQRACPKNTASHASMAFDPVALQWIRNALDHSGPANPRFNPRCG
jgi:triacylglycerol esterase/lipase EstA (alpha/beta hydrolase family)